MPLNEMITLCYVIDSKYDEDNGELGDLFANTATSNMHKLYC